MDARVLWVGEAPGVQEVAQGKPFVGPTGHIVRKTLEWAGIDVERDVRFTNAVKHNPGKFPPDASGARLLREYASALDDEISRMVKLEILVACGGPAMTRLLGRRSSTGHSWGINEWRGWVFRNADLPDVYRWHPKDEGWLCRMPEGVRIVATLHPAGIMRSKGRDDMVVFRQDVAKIARMLDGGESRVEMHTHFHPTPSLLMRAFEQCDEFYFDTEYHRETKQVFWFGVTFDGVNVFGFPWEAQYYNVVKAMMESGKVKGAHNVHADVEALMASGIPVVNGPWYDTMVGMHALHPALEVGLDDAARFYIDDVQPWKDMDHSDPYYNALDVAIGAHVKREQLKEAGGRLVDPSSEINARMKLLEVTYDMRHRGMQVDPAMQRRLKEAAQQRIEELNAKVMDAVKPYWDVRVRAAMEKEYAVEQKYQDLRGEYVGTCEKHPTYNGLRKPAQCDTCVRVYEGAGDLRRLYGKVKKDRTRTKLVVKRWQEGFSPTNNEHLRWLLYDPSALKLPVQRNPITRKVTADRGAVDKLSSLAVVQRRKRAFEIVLDVKAVQHLEKAISTFINVPTDEQNVAHPPYKVHGTRTGRLAGGGDSDERSDNRYAFNALNIPREWRRMYVPPPGHVIVEADWRNVEGRLTAHFCKDRNYSAALDGELQGGHKVHAINAGIIYGIEPGDAGSHVVELSGQERTAYDGGKRLTHAWSYGMQPPHMAKTFNISIKEAVRIDVALSTAYPQLVRWRNQLVDDVLGVWERRDGRNICTRPGRRVLSNPFGWQFQFLGVGAAQANEVIAFLPQSTGAGMWTRCAPALEDRYPVFTGTYDSFYLIVENTSRHRDEAIETLKGVMQRQWGVLGGKSFPIEVSVGMNMGKYDERNNPYGLKEVG